uniref:5-methyltetrahydropteroyltriglutamate-- homocysteine methyltransferase-like n=1 Tax=Nicotiana tabacum TaxID=4097 RepID=A0A1S4AL25_TOBAC|nr:PREDICTED: 5-methyltetrahydropteroyltriglutamate--homocysteine methyltransferase-like [Nicotiana tabacum]
MEQGSIMPDTRIYNVVIDALCKDRMMDAAISLFEEMKQKGIPPDVITYNSLIDGLCKFGQLEKVRTLFFEMVNLNIYPDVQTLTIVTDGLCKDEKLLSVLGSYCFFSDSSRILGEGYVKYITKEISKVVKLQEELDFVMLMPKKLLQPMDGFNLMDPAVLSLQLSMVMSVRKTNDCFLVFTGTKYEQALRFETCSQIALAIKDEVEDLEKAGINVIQVDGAALREALPLRKPKEAFYLNWPVDSFRITNFSVQDTTQVDIQSCPHSASQMVIIISVKVCCA